MRILSITAALALGFTTPAMAQDINFGDDSSDWANDGECDDGRFTGEGLTSTPLLEEDVLADATDCRTAYEAGKLTLLGVAADGSIDFGNDDGEWSNDGECDDMRFEGPGMTSTPLLQDDIMRDASDCREAFEAGQLALRGQGAPDAPGTPDVIIKGVNFGNDNGDWSNDGECDDPRFEGAGMTSTPLLADDVLRDATDCSTAFMAGNLTLRGVDAKGNIDFGNDDGEWSNDGECDDMRFEGPGMTSTVLLFDDIMSDATDCQTAYEAGALTLVGQ
ncbi:hypothetical protein QTO30_17740 [Yoonia sp. GPGPB17]|uniref:hypothetical protein n=1 Tax=Yoonia sp. GPGPB17 TaxID=3026147 RepID=UPI0030BC430B